MNIKNQSYLDELFSDFLKYTKIPPPFLLWIAIICLIASAISGSVWVIYAIYDYKVNPMTLSATGVWVYSSITAWAFSIYISITKNTMRGAMLTDAILSSFLIAIAGGFGLYIIIWFRGKNRERKFWDEFLG